MEKDLLSGLVTQVTMENGNTTKRVDKESSDIRKVIITRANGQTTKQMGLEFIKK